MQSGEVWLEFVLQSGNRSLIRKAAISGLDERTYGCDVLVGTEIDHHIRKTVSPYDEVRKPTRLKPFFRLAVIFVTSECHGLLTNKQLLKPGIGGQQMSTTDAINRLQETDYRKYLPNRDCPFCRSPLMYWNASQKRDGIEWEPFCSNMDCYFSWGDEFLTIEDMSEAMNWRRHDE
jgi:hypothetical protein